MAGIECNAMTTDAKRIIDIFCHMFQGKDISGMTLPLPRKGINGDSNVIIHIDDHVYIFLAELQDSAVIRLYMKNIDFEFKAIAFFLLIGKEVQLCMWPNRESVDSSCILSTTEELQRAFAM